MVLHRGMLDSDEALPLFTLSLTPSLRFRILVGSRLLGNVLAEVPQLLVTGYVLSSKLGWYGLLYARCSSIGWQDRTFNSAKFKVFHNDEQE